MALPYLTFYSPMRRIKISSGKTLDRRRVGTHLNVPISLTFCLKITQIRHFKFDKSKIPHAPHLSLRSSALDLVGFK